MAVWRRLESWLSWFPWYRRKAREADLERELRDHLQLEADEQRAAGLSPEEAVYAAHRALGNTLKIEEDVRAAWGFHWLETLVEDLRYGLRQLCRNPGFTAVTVLTLALGIGANTAIFSIVDAVLLQPLPFKDANRLMHITEYRPGDVDITGVSFPDYLVWKQQNTVFEETAAYFFLNDVVLGGPSSVERERYSTVSNSFFTILGVRPMFGHGFTAADEIPGGPKIFLASYALWRGLLGGDPHAIGKSYVLDGENYTLAGVMPPGFDFPEGCSVWVPTSTLGTRGVNDRISHAYHVLGRLRKGVSVAQAQAQIESIQERLAKIYPKTDADWLVLAQPLLNEIVGNVRASLLVLLGAVGFVLLIACANVVNLMLARGSARQKEFAIRAALGAGRKRLLRQNLTESFLIVCISLILAAALAKWGLMPIVSLVSIHLPRVESFHLSMPVLVFLAFVAALTTFLVGIAPALEASQNDPQGALRDGQSGHSSAPRNQGLRNGLVVSEVALAILLLSGAGLMLRSFVQLNRVNPGFQTEHLLTFKVALPGAAYPRAAQTKVFADRVLARLESLPGVQEAAVTTTLPLSGQSNWDWFQVVGHVTQDWTRAPTAEVRWISPNYFLVLEIPLLRGRQFTAADVQAKNTIIINEAMAKRFWPGSDPVGQQLINIDDSNPREIIGVAADAKSFGLGSATKPEMYIPYGGAWYTNFVVRTSQDPSSLASEARVQAAAIDKGVPLYQVATMDQLLDRSLAPQRFNLFLLGLFAVIALALAAIGIYGVLAFSISRRTHEIGIRLALGAHPRQILRLVGWQGMRLVTLGLILGLSASFVLTRLMASLLYAVSPTDPLTFVSAAILLAFVALLACYIPARRAMRVDPMVALRYE
jgi:predicted permease